jgi:hypothetical protein
MQVAATIKALDFLPESAPERRPIAGKKVDEALNLLKFSNKKGR